MNPSTEPEYRYVKGQGWQLAPKTEEVTLVFRDGTRARLEAREPNVGERYKCGWGDKWITEPGVPDLHAWASSLVHSYSIWEAASLCEEGTVAHWNEFTKNTAGWVTVVPL